MTNKPTKPLRGQSRDQQLDEATRDQELADKLEARLDRFLWERDR